MLESISKTEKADILLTLALAFEKKLSEKPEKTASGLMDRLLTVLNFEDSKTLKARAEYYDRLPPEKRKNWQKLKLDKIRGRGLSVKLDTSIHPLQIAAILNLEPKQVQIVILKNLPLSLSRQIASALKTNPSEIEISADQSNLNSSISDEIIALVRDKFISNFIAL